MDDTAGPPRTSDVAAMGSESDDATSSNSSKTRPVDDDDASPVSAGSVSDDEYRNRSSIRAASPESHAPAAAAVTTSCPTITTPSMPHPQPLPPGCGCVAAAADQDEITVCITPTTGGQFELAVDRNDTVENLKKIISKKLKVAKERICLLHRERQLREGTLAENGLQNDSRLTLLPSVETGLLAQRPEQSVMQALESLNDSQVNDFLSGKAPLNLTMRLGDHMMLIQLQLSTVTPATPTATQVSSTSGNGHNHHSNSNSSSSNSNVVGLSNSGNATSVSNLSGGHSSLQTTRRCLTAKSPANIVKPQNAAGAPAGRTSHLISNLASALHAAASYSSSSSSSSSSNSSSLPTASITTTTTSPVCSSRVTTSSSSVTAAPISPTHLSSSASGNPGQSTRSNSHGVSSTNGNSSSACQPCPLYHHHHHHHGHHHHNHHYHHHHHHHHHYSKNKSNVPNLSSSFFPSSFSSGLSQIQGQSALESASYDATLPRKKLCSGHHHHGQSSSSVTTGSMDVTRSQQEDSNPQSPTCTSSLMLEQSPPKPATLDTRALAEASRNLTQKLKQLSSEENARRRQGAIIESMHHHGKGVYSGTFSGTLNPALQDRHGRPKRDISTIIHILNDLLCATPAASAGHYRHHHHRHSHTRQQSSSMSASAGTTAAANGPTTSIGCNDSTPGYSSEELSKENEATKGKMRRLRLVMEQRRAKRKARRQARAAPYTTQWAAMTPADPNHEPNTSTPTSGTTTTTNSAEPQNEPELQPCSPEPVVA